jgi:TRAP-type C4-dicarboxylate transport system permease small subunit
MEYIVSTFEKRTAKLLEYICLFLLTAIMIIVLASVLARVTGAFGIDWFEEIVGMGISWMVFIKAALLFKQDDHLQVELLAHLLSNKRKLIRIYNIFLYSVTFLALLGFTVVSFALCYTTRKSSPMLGVTFKLWYFSMCFSSALSAVYIFVKMIREFRR